ncbi:MAG: glutamine-hydrolyzing carbamoyl-phosphate synthase small subunit [Candidatus Goldbacteria bacterium]|nr:glutamine-hydrolyzing carbamoyl-phosphate synthase small subunit [Candidatus Goldiibacteriota bacterium]
MKNKKSNTKNKIKKAMLVLEDGTYFEGISAGASGERFGEIVFNTSMMGYQEVLTDPSYKGQIVVMTYPEIGNYGFNMEDTESIKPWVEGFVVKEMCQYPSNWRSIGSLSQYLIKNNIPAIEGIDTRALTKHIRDFGAMRAVISTIDLDYKSLLKKVKNSESIVGKDLIKYVTIKNEYIWEKDKSLPRLKISSVEDKFLEIRKNKKIFKVAVFDYGIKHEILRIFAELNCKIIVLPADTDADRIKKINPDGIFLSNGPGDPEGAPYVYETLKKLLGFKPIFGICFGHQFLGLALGGKTYKMKFGHRGANQPVIDLQTRKVDITVQNHGFAVDPESFKKSKYKVNITHINLNDKTVEGLEAPEIKAYSVQYHPEASAGPHDARYVFAKFIKNMETWK